MRIVGCGTNGGAMMMAGVLVYPSPASRMVTAITTSLLTTATASAPVPPPPMILTVGAFVYPNPSSVTKAPTTKPPTMLAVAVAACGTSTVRTATALVTSRQSCSRPQNSRRRPPVARR